eukprot:scaffold13640_cov65-Attheya_sp.AAC.3
MADDGYRATFYRELPTTRSMRAMPRFGHSDSFSSLFDSGSDGQTDYILGLLFAAVFILVLFVLWGILLLIFKCLGQKRVGFLSGSAFASPKDSKKPIIIRSAFLISAFLILVFSGLSVTRGLNNLYNTVDTLIDSSREINKLMDDANVVSSSLASAGSTTRATRDLLPWGRACVGKKRFQEISMFPIIWASTLLCPFHYPIFRACRFNRDACKYKCRYEKGAHTCKEGDPPVLFLGDYKENLGAAFTTLQNLKFEIGNTTLATLEEICQEDIGPLNVLLSSLSSEITLLLAFAKSAIELLACRRVAPIYTNTFYTGTCKYSVEGVSWAFTSFLLIAIFSFTMIMFRSSWLVSDGMEYHDPENDYLGDEAVEVAYVEKEDTKKEQEAEKFPDEELMRQDVSMSC